MVAPRRFFGWPAIAALAPAAFAVFPGCAPSPVAPDVLLITIDTLTTARVGCYGHPHARTPAIDRLARRGLLVRDAISPAPLTLPAHSTMLTGVTPAVHGVRDNGLFRLDDAWDTVPELIPADVRRAAFVGAYPLERRFHLSQGFERYDDRFPSSSNPYARPQRRARAVFKRAAEWLEAASPEQSSFLWVHVFDPHFPYAAPRRWAALDGFPGTGPYECEVAYTDHELHRFLARLERRGRPEPTVLLTSDHGESLGRHGENTHGFFVYDATQRVPLVLSHASGRVGIETALRSLADVAPTLLEVCAAPASKQHEGTSLLRPTETDGVYVENRSTEYLRGWSSLYGFRTAQWKYVRAPRSELYDLGRDPEESVNRLDEFPDVVAALSARVDAVLAESTDPTLQRVEPEVIAKLQSLGYLATIEPGTASHPTEDPKDHVAGVVAMFRGQEEFLRGNLLEARRLLEEALASDPQMKRAHSYLAGTYLQLRDFDACIQHGLAFLDIPPAVNEGPVHLTLGEAYLASGRPREAVEHLRRAREVDPGSRRAAKLLAAATQRVN